MPYIKSEDRSKYTVLLHTLNAIGINTPGELNYLLSSVCLQYLWRKEKRYSTYNDIIGALECAKQEMYRREIAPYEEKKIGEEGDIF